MPKPEPVEIIDRRHVSGVSELEPESPLLFDVPRTYEDPRPRFDNILIARNEEETTWNGTRFIIPDTARKKPNLGVVVAISDFYIVGDTKFPTSELVNPGDIVTFGAFQSETLKRGEQEYELVSVFDIKLIEKCTYAVTADAART